MGEGGLDGFSFWLEASWSETTTCNTPIFWAWAIGNQWFWNLLFLFTLWDRRKKLNSVNTHKTGWGGENNFDVDWKDGCT